MTTYEQLDLLFERNHGIVKTAQVLEHGIAKHTLYAYAKKSGIEQAAHGIYITPDAWTDAMYIFHLRCAQGVFSHESALFLHDLTDREPNFRRNFPMLPICPGTQSWIPSAVCMSWHR